MINEELYAATLLKVREIIAEETGSDIDEILPDMHLEDELEIADDELLRLTKIINSKLGTSLNAAEIEEEESVVTVRELSIVVCEEIELG